ncbi:MAG: DUF86 domain-containing protein [Candidatus Diapherotrites archaeon]|nr:DUF86 domain-containing protein [Candidatus Diapherotrites archaeon]
MRRKILERELQRSILLVEENLPPTYEDFRELPQIVKDGIYKRVEQAIEVIYDIMAEIIREKNLETPSDDYSIPEILREAGLITTAEEKTLRAMRGFRNILVHVYEDLDEELAYENIREGVKDLKNFLEKFANE